jgi:hypothetical protein
MFCQEMLQTLSQERALSLPLVTLFMSSVDFFWHKWSQFVHFCIYVFGNVLTITSCLNSYESWQVNPKKGGPSRKEPPF